MNTFFYISGIVFWSVLTLVALYFIIPTVWRLIKPMANWISNLKFYFFGAKWCKEFDMANIYFSQYANRPGIRAHWHSRKGFRRLAYSRFLKMAKAAMPKYLEERRKAFAAAAELNK